MAVLATLLRSAAAPFLLLARRAAPFVAPLLPPVLAAAKEFGRSLPRASPYAQNPLGQYAPFITMFGLSCLFYIQITSLTRFLAGCDPRVSSRLHRSSPLLAPLQRWWLALSLLACLSVFLSEAYAQLSGSDLLLLAAGGSPGGSGRGRARGLRLELSWLCTWACVLLDTTLTSAATSPFALRLLAWLLPAALARSIHPPPLPAQPEEAAKESARRGGLSLGAKVEALRVLDCSDALLSRLACAALIFICSKYGT
jgi:hypothetical protein